MGLAAQRVSVRFHRSPGRLRQYQRKELGAASLFPRAAGRDRPKPGSARSSGTRQGPAVRQALCCRCGEGCSFGLGPAEGQALKSYWSPFLFARRSRVVADPRPCRRACGRRR
jgi:hypothetical protein